MSQFPENALSVGGNDPFLPSLLQAINHASAISITVAFTRQTGLNLLFSALDDAVSRGVKVRLLTGDYLGVTEPSALRKLLLLKERGAEVKVFESSNQSFHMKAYIFTLPDNIKPTKGCAFVGSSNISKAALTTGFEWNLMVTLRENPERFQQILDEFENIYRHPQCIHLTNTWINTYIQRRAPIQFIAATGNARSDDAEEPPVPSPIQTEALVALKKTRANNFSRGLVVMATGLGKTWLAAFDSQQFKAKKVLFVAHSEEILKQAEETFVRIRPEASTGRYNATSKDAKADLLFASIQTLGKDNHLNRFDHDDFDYIVVDEFHHASARTYQKLLSHFKPKFLLGLTATPERTDQSDILALCDDNLVFNRGLFAGVEAKLLCPFNYYGISDVVDYQEVSWRNGKFDPNDLTNKFATTSRAKHNLKHWKKHHQSRTLAFCVSTKHADFMASYFNKNGIQSASVHSNSDIRRNQALQQLENGDLQVIFSVDLFNEGVDLPSIDTVLMLRPTDSKIIFLQQLGRGLRLSPDTGKQKLVILDFIGNHISFFRKPEALFNTGVTNRERKEFIKQVKSSEISIPDGCFINFDLESIKFLEKLISNRADQQLEVYIGLRDSFGRRPTLSEFYQAGGSINRVRQEHGQWHNFVANQSDLDSLEKQCLEFYAAFLKELEVTALTKSYKSVLIEALIELNGFSKPPPTETLAVQSYEVLQRRRTLLSDLPVEFREFNALPSSHINRWHSYWKRNPIKAWTSTNKSGVNAFFTIENNHFRFNLDVKNDLLDTFSLLVQEIINYRFLQYEDRPTNRATPSVTTIEQPVQEELQAIPYFSDLKIACGHFKSSEHSLADVQLKALPFSYGRLDPAKHFLARASGNSMNGGKKPIKDGDYLLLELITPTSAGSNNGRTVAIERQDVSGDDQYLLRTVKKLSQQEYQLLAQNPDYQSIMATEDMNTFARLKQVISAEEINSFSDQ